MGCIEVTVFGGGARQSHLATHNLIQSLGLIVWSSGFEVEGLGFRVYGSGFRV